LEEPILNFLVKMEKNTADIYKILWQVSREGMSKAQVL
jgi:hypothetical protein